MSRCRRRALEVDVEVADHDVAVVEVGVVEVVVVVVDVAACSRRRKKKLRDVYDGAAIRDVLHLVEDTWYRRGRLADVRGRGRR